MLYEYQVKWMRDKSLDVTDGVIFNVQNYIKIK
jgi:hypothetical protein